MHPTARSLVLDLLSTLRRGSMPVRALVEAGGLFGLAENAVRVALARLYATGRVERDERGRYRLGRGAEAIRRRVTSWRRIHERLGPWRGGWVGVQTGALPRARGRERRRAERALRFLGFRPLGPGLALRPDNLVGGVEGVRAQLAALGLPGEAPVFGVGDLDPERDLLARSLWDGAALVEDYERSRAELRESEERLGRLPSEEAMVESFLLGGRVLRQIVLDPLLPEPIVPGAARASLLASMRHYDRVGRSCWAAFLRRFDVPHLQSPVDLRLGEAAEGITDGERVWRDSPGATA